MTRNLDMVVPLGVSRETSEQFADHAEEAAHRLHRMAVLDLRLGREDMRALAVGIGQLAKVIRSLASRVRP